MKNLSSKKFSLIISSIAACSIPFMATTITSCSSSHKIQFANFESYMDNDLIGHLQDSYDVQFQWFTVAEMIETKFKDTYDVAVPCGYELTKLYKKGWLQEIDWQELIGMDDPMSLYSEVGKKAIQQMNDAFINYCGLPADFNLLDYGVPYFAQSFSFVYKGEEIEFYKSTGNHEKVDEPTWADIFYTIGPKSKYGDRFNGKTAMLDDSKSIYDAARIVETIEQNPEHPELATNEMPANSSIDSLKETFKSLTSKAQSNWYRLSTDSGQIARILADHGEHGYNAALAWSGDALYAAQGAGEYDSYTGDQMHVVKPKGASLDEIDFIVINKKNANNPEKLSRIYDAIYDICFDGYDQEDILKKDGDRYKYWSMQNWDTVSYVPLLDKIYSEVSNPASKYWDDYADEEDMATRNLMTSLISIPDQVFAKSLFGLPLTDLQNSDTHWAWLETRGNF